MPGVDGEAVRGPRFYLMRAGRKDAAHKPIAQALRAVGASVVDLAGVGVLGVPDLLVGYRGRCVLLEVKNPGEVAREDQTEWANKWRGCPVFVVHTPEEAISALQDRAGSTKSGGPDS